MSVPVGKRKPSSIQYIDTARKLVVHTLHYVKKFPKSAMFLITKDIMDLSRKIYQNVVTANEIYPKTKLDIELRYKYLKDALGCISTMDCFLGIAKDTYENDITDYGWVQWGELMSTEENLIKKVLASDNKLEVV